MNLDNNEILQLCNLYNINVQDLNYLCRKTTPWCRCGMPKKLILSKQSLIGAYLYRCCGQTICEPLTGIKRPKHSEHMKNLAITDTGVYKKTLMQKGKLKNSLIDSRRKV